MGKMKKEFNLIIHRDSDGYYVASVPELRGCHTQAKSLDELLERIKETVQICLVAEWAGSEPTDFVSVSKNKLN